MSFRLHRPKVAHVELKRKRFFIAEHRKADNDDLETSTAESAASRIK